MNNKTQTIYTMIVTHMNTHMKYFLTVLVCLTLFSNCNPSQHLYYNIEGEKISKEKFDQQLDYGKNVNYIQKHGSITKTYLVDRKYDGKFDQATIDAIKVALQKSIGHEVSKTTSLRIIYYLNVDEDIDFMEMTRNLPYTQQVELEFKNYKTLHISNASYKFDQKKYDVLVDSLDIIAKYFVNKKIMCVNYLLIQPDGSFKYCIGEGCERFR